MIECDVAVGFLFVFAALAGGKRYRHCFYCFESWLAGLAEPDMLFKILKNLIRARDRALTP